MLIKFFTALFLPPLFNLLLLLSAVPIRLLGYKKSAYSLALFSLLSLCLFSTPFVTGKILQSLILPNSPVATYQQAALIVVLGGGVRHSEMQNGFTVSAIPLERMRYAAYLQQKTALPILVSGGSLPQQMAEAEIMAREFSDFYHIDVKWLENQANNTAENARFTRQLLVQQAEPVKTIVLVTNDWHMKRAKMLFEREGFNVLPASVSNSLTCYQQVMCFTPNAYSLWLTSLALKEWLAITYYQLFE